MFFQSFNHKVSLDVMVYYGKSKYTPGSDANIVHRNRNAFL